MGWIAGKEWALIKRSLAAMVVITVAQLAIAPAMDEGPTNVLVTPSWRDIAAMFPILVW